MGVGTDESPLEKAALNQISVSEADRESIPRLVKMFLVLLQDLLPASLAQLLDSGADPVVFRFRPFPVSLLRKLFSVLLQLFPLGRLLHFPPRSRLVESTKGGEV